MRNLLDEITDIIAITQAAKVRLLDEEPVHERDNLVSVLAEVGARRFAQQLPAEEIRHDLLGEIVLFYCL